MDDVRALLRAFEAFFEHVASVSWAPLGIAVCLHLLRLTFRVRAWQNILAAAHPGVEVPFAGIFGAYVAGVGVNALTPARGGDVVKLYLAKRRVDGSAYPTLGSTLLVETLFDFVVAAALFIWAIQAGLLPGVPELPALPAFDWTFVIEHPELSAILGSVLLGALILGVTWASRHVRAFSERVRQGFAILQDRRAFATQVVSWQLLSWIARVATVFFFLRAFHVEATLKTALAVIVVQSLSTLLPFTPGGIGTQQAVLLFVLAGTATRSAVLSFSIGMHFVILVINAALGFAAIGLMLGTFRWRRHAESARDGLANGEQAPEPSQPATRG